MKRPDRLKNIGTNYKFTGDDVNKFDIKDDIASMTLLFEQVVNHKGLPLIE